MVEFSFKLLAVVDMAVLTISEEVVLFSFVTAYAAIGKAKKIAIGIKTRRQK